MRTFRVPALVIANGVALSLAGAGQASPPTSGFYGIVLRGPTKPVCELGMSCEAPAPGVTLLFSRAGQVVGRVTTTAAGTYRIALPPGRYAVRTTRKFLGGGLTPTLVTASAGRRLRIVFRVDTGIR